MYLGWCFALLVGLGSLVLQIARDTKQATKNLCRSRTALRKYQELDIERMRHYWLCIHCYRDGRHAESRWHRQIVERLQVQVDNAWLEYAGEKPEHAHEWGN